MKDWGLEVNWETLTSVFRGIPKLTAVSELIERNLMELLTYVTMS